MAIGVRYGIGKEYLIVVILELIIKGESISEARIDLLIHIFIAKFFAIKDTFRPALVPGYTLTIVAQPREDKWSHALFVECAGLGEIAYVEGGRATIRHIFDTEVIPTGVSPSIGVDPQEEVILLLLELDDTV